MPETEFGRGIDEDDSVVAVQAPPKEEKKRSRPRKRRRERVTQGDGSPPEELVPPSSERRRRAGMAPTGTESGQQTTVKFYGRGMRLEELELPRPSWLVKGLDDQLVYISGPADNVVVEAARKKNYNLSFDYYVSCYGDDTSGAAMVGETEHDDT